MKAAIEKVTKLTEGAWETALTPAEVGVLGRPLAQEPGPSVLLAEEVEEANGGTMIFAPGAITVLNRGTVTRAFIFERSSGDSLTANQSRQAGDDAFLKEAAKAGQDVEEFARRMLQEVRKLDPQGELVSFPGRRFINKPDNFVVLVPQPRIGELKVVIRGSPHEFQDAPEDLKADQNGYSTFKIKDATDLTCGLSVLQQVRRKR